MKMTLEQEKFEEAKRLQHEFWEALTALEDVLDIEIDGTRDLADTTIEDLKKDPEAAAARGDGLCCTDIRCELPANHEGPCWNPGEKE
jgi:hypothetical protein